MRYYIMLFICEFASLQKTDNKKKTEETTFEIEEDITDSITYDETERKWVKMAVVSVGYYLRSHKFNNFDRRYYNDTPPAKVNNLFGSFADPPLRHFHWEVFEHCKVDFISCLRYLYETILDTFLQHSMDTIYIMRSNNLTFEEKDDEIKKIDEECNKMQKLDWTRAEPFKGPIERFQWATTASYYMCWFTMKEEPDLAHFNEPCDNFASCLQKGAITNDDYRANDSIPFQCAWYSFCPDACCRHDKLLKSLEDCESLSNPCGRFNNKTCSLDRTLNRSFISAIYNEWNVTCACLADQYKWNSRYGLCIDFNECQHKNPCNTKTEECYNLKGTFICRCKFGYTWSTDSKTCEQYPIVTKALKRFSGIETVEDECIWVKPMPKICLLIVTYLLKKL